MIVSNSTVKGDQNTVVATVVFSGLVFQIFILISFFVIIFRIKKTFSLYNPIKFDITPQRLSGFSFD